MKIHFLKPMDQANTPSMAYMNGSKILESMT